MADQPRVKGRRDNIVRTITRPLAMIGRRHIIRHILARQFRQRLGSRNLHRLINLTRMHIQRTAENIREPKHIIHLVRIV